MKERLLSGYANLLNKGMLPIVVFPFISLFYDEVVDAKKRQEQQQICATFGMSEDFRPNDYSLQTNNDVKN